MDRIDVLVIGGGPAGTTAASAVAKRRRSVILLERDAHPDSTLTLDVVLERGPYVWRVATRDASGEVGPFGDAQPFILRPAPNAPQTESEVGEEALVLRWQAGLPGQSYEVQMADDEAFTGSLRSERTTEPEFAMATPEKTMYFRVRTIDVDGYEGPFGTTQRIEPPSKNEPWWLLLLPLLLLAL